VNGVAKAGGVTLRPATHEDRFLVRRWWSDPRVQARSRNAASAEAEITLAMSSSTALVRMIEHMGEPIGYARAVEGGLWGEAGPEGLPAGTWDLDVLIPSEQHQRSGLGERVLALLTEEVFSTTLAIACSAVVPVRDEAAVRCYERAGFRWQRIWLDPLSGPSWLLLRERPAPRQAR
jgi:aminoglycoside 6'-N-acetyltransferase